MQRVAGWMRGAWDYSNSHVYGLGFLKQKRGRFCCLERDLGSGLRAALLLLEQQQQSCENV